MGAKPGVGLGLENNPATQRHEKEGQDDVPIACQRLVEGQAMLSFPYRNPGLHDFIKPANPLPFYLCITP